MKSTRIYIYLVIFFSMIFFTYLNTSAMSRFQSGYNFDSEDPRADINNIYLLQEDLFGPIRLNNNGRFGKGSESFASFNKDMFNNTKNLTFTVWVSFKDFQNIAERKIFYAGKGNDDIFPHMYLNFINDTYKTLTLVAKQNDNVIEATTQLYNYLSPESDNWLQLGFVFENIGDLSILRLYVNGRKVAESIGVFGINDIAPTRIYISNFVMDEIYVTNVALDDAKMDMLYIYSVQDFIKIETSLMYDPVNPEDPNNYYPDNPDDPDNPNTNDPENPDEHNNYNPDNPNQYNPLPSYITPTYFNWIAYCFDSSFNLGQDLKKVLSNVGVNDFNVTGIDTIPLNGQFKNGITRRTDKYPQSYLSLPAGILADVDGFTFSAWVYRQIDKTVEDPNIVLDFKKNNDWLFMFTGASIFGFSPIASDETNEYNANIQIGSQYINPQKILLGNNGRLAKDNDNKWVHYALTFYNNEINIYVDGVLSDTLNSPYTLRDLNFTNIMIGGGCSPDNLGKTIIDEIYIAQKALTPADIRKLRYYGVEEFTTKVLPDPAPNKQDTTSNTENPNIDIRPDNTDDLEDRYTETAKIDGYIGTSFDDSGLIGKDLNGGVTAIIRNASLTQGQVKYGLLLDGSNGYLRYPNGILDGATELTISIAFNWNGHMSTVRNQRLFDFANKVNSIDKPVKYYYVDMGNGASSLSFVMNDGKNETTLTCNEQISIGIWTRITVVIKDNLATMYINDKQVSSANTNVSLSSINPNFCYVGKSNVKGDPLFKGVVDEIYISDRAVNIEKIEQLIEGIVPVNKSQDHDTVIEDSMSVWDNIIKGVLIATTVLILLIIVVIIITIIKK